jgi:homoserine O-succinyltransferase
LRRRDREAPIVVGLVNNTADGALRATERQFRSVLRAAARDVEVELKLFSLPEVPRAGRAREHVDAFYEDIADLWTSEFDALIVTGTEPQANDLPSEPIWGSVTRLVDWAEARAVPVVWSCLAAHAAVLYLDGIERSRLREKLSGVFACHPASPDHPLMAGVPGRWWTPHSRQYELHEDALRSSGYQIVSRSEQAGADLFLKRTAAPFVFFQGHPEYGAGSLLHEYLRDVRRYFAGERDRHPAIPVGYFDRDTEAEIIALRDRSLADRRDTSLVDELTQVASRARYATNWQGHAAAVYANLLTWIGGIHPAPAEGVAR